MVELAALVGGVEVLVAAVVVLDLRREGGREGGVGGVVELAALVGERSIGCCRCGTGSEEGGREGVRGGKIGRAHV